MASSLDASTVHTSALSGPPGAAAAAHGLLHGAHGPPPGRQVRRRGTTRRGGLGRARRSPPAARRTVRPCRPRRARPRPGSPARAPRRAPLPTPTRRQPPGPRPTSTLSSAGSSPGSAVGSQVRALIGDAPHGGRGSQLVHPGQVEVGDVVDGCASVGGMPGRPVELHLQQHALGSRFARDLAQPTDRVLPHRDHPAGRQSPRLGAQRHPERGQGQHRGPRIVGEHAGVPGGPPGRELWPVEQEGHHQRGADRADQLGHTVEPRQVLADHGRDGDAATEVEEVHAPLGDVHRLPPANAREEAPPRGRRPRSGRRPGTTCGACSAGSATSARPAAGRCARRCRGTGPSRPGPGAGRRPASARPGAASRASNCATCASSRQPSGSTTTSTPSTSSRAASTSLSTRSMSSGSEGS